MSRLSENRQEVVRGKGHRVLHTQQLAQEGKADPSGTTRTSDRVRLVEKEIGLSEAFLTFDDARERRSHCGVS
jgi:hypothetical protein